MQNENPHQNYKSPHIIAFIAHFRERAFFLGGFLWTETEQFKWNRISIARFRKIITSCFRTQLLMWNYGVVWFMAPLRSHSSRLKLHPAKPKKRLEHPRHVWMAWVWIPMFWNFSFGIFEGELSLLPFRSPDFLVHFLPTSAPLRSKLAVDSGVSNCFKGFGWKLRKFNFDLDISLCIFCVIQKQWICVFCALESRGSYMVHGNCVKSHLAIIGHRRSERIHW